MSETKRYEAHLFICTNHREAGESCAVKGSLGLREDLKEICRDPSRGWHGRVRVNSAGCLGKCSEGITAVLYPQNQWFTQLVPESKDDLKEVISKVLISK